MTRDNILDAVVEAQNFIDRARELMDCLDDKKPNPSYPKQSAAVKPAWTSPASSRRCGRSGEVFSAFISALLAMSWRHKPKPVESTPNHRRTTGTRAAQRAAEKQRRKRGRK